MTVIVDNSAKQAVTNVETRSETSSVQEQRHILAEKFKTMPCRKYMENGNCPYENRCMFAHGDDDRRTYEDNVRDGIYTEEAILSWQRARKLITRSSSTDMGSKRLLPHMLLPPPPLPPPPPSYQASINYLMKQDEISPCENYQNEYFVNDCCYDVPENYINKEECFSISSISNADGLSDHSVDSPRNVQSEYCRTVAKLMQMPKKNRRVRNDPYNTAGFNKVVTSSTRSIAVKKQNMLIYP